MLEHEIKYVYCKCGKQIDTREYRNYNNMCRKCNLDIINEKNKQKTTLAKFI